STADSGNLAGHLLTLVEACRQLVGCPLLSSQVLSGIGDAVALIRASAPASAGRKSQTVTKRQLDATLFTLDSLLTAEPETQDEWSASLAELSIGLHAVVDVARALAREEKESANAE